MTHFGRTLLVGFLLALGGWACSSSDSSGAGGAAPGAGGGGAAGAGGAGAAGDGGSSGSGDGGAPGTDGGGAAGPDGGPAADITTLVPQNNEVSGWTVDPAFGAVRSANNYTDAANLPGLDGAVDPFFSDAAPNAVAVAWENYLNGTLKLDYRLWQMASATDCKGIYDALVRIDSQTASLTWSTLSAIGDMARLSYAGGIARVQACKNAYYAQAMISGTGAQADKETGAQAFITAAFAKLP